MRLRQPTISYDRDEQFAVSLLTLLRHRGQTLPPAAQATLIALATEPHGFGHARTQAAVKTLLSLHPVLAKSVALDDMQSLSFLPVCIWAAEQKGNPDCGLRATVESHRLATGNQPTKTFIEMKAGLDVLVNGAPPASILKNTGPFDWEGSLSLLGPLTAFIYQRMHAEVRLINSASLPDLDLSLVQVQQDAVCVVA